MKFPWALCLERADAAALAPLRLTPGIEVAEAGRQIWLRGQAPAESLVAGLLALPAVGRFEWQAPDRLRRLDQRIPAHHLPAGAWQPLQRWLRLRLPAAALPANDPLPARLRLIRTSTEQSPDWLLTSMHDLLAFAAQAAQVRLDRLRFAAHADGGALVRGRPLPALTGPRFVSHGDVAVAVGFTWAPAVHTEVLARSVGASGSTPVLWREDGTLVRLHLEQFVSLTRGAVAATMRALDNGA